MDNEPKLDELEHRITKLVAIIQDLQHADTKTDSSNSIQSLLSNIPAAIFRCTNDKHWTVELISDYIENITGFPASDFIGYNILYFHSVINSSCTNMVFETIENAINNKSHYEIEYSIKAANGEQLWLFEKGQGVFDEDDKLLFLDGAIWDITEQKRNTFEQKELLSEFEAIFNNSAIGIAYLKEDRTVYRINQRAREIFGYTEKELIGKSAKDIHISTDKFNQFADKYFSRLRDGETIKTEYEFRNKIGGRIWCSLWGKAINPPELDNGIIWIVEDISESKHLEQLKEDIERMMHHDIKNPLGNIMMLQSLLKQSPNINKDELKYIDYIGESGKQIQKLIEMPIDLFKMETGTYEFQPVRFDIIDLLKNASADQSYITQEATSIIKIYINGKALKDGDSIFIGAEEHLCFNMFCNLIANAREASKSDEAVSIYIKDNNTIDITVSNNGAVPEKIRQSFFEKYSTEGKRKGTGLGTYSAKLIAETQGATISMQTSKEDGTKITVSFPKS